MNRFKVLKTIKETFSSKTHKLIRSKTYKKCSKKNFTDRVITSNQPVKLKKLASALSYGKQAESITKTIIFRKLRIEFGLEV
jgi:hypothetical protein